MIRFLIILIPVIMFFGCSHHQTVSDFGKWDIQNAATSRQLAEDLLSTWSLNSGFIRGALGTRIDQLPQSAVLAMDRLDELADKEEPLSDKELGETLGLRVRMLGALVRQALEMFAPEILTYIKFL